MADIREEDILSREEIIKNHKELLEAIKKDEKRLEEELERLREPDTDIVEFVNETLDEPYELEGVL